MAHKLGKKSGGSGSKATHEKGQKYDHNNKSSKQKNKVQMKYKKRGFVEPPAPAGLIGGILNPTTSNLRPVKKVNTAAATPNVKLPQYKGIKR
ncbi:hypothetical protein [Aquimarina algiphila]|uniref:hypothetical protein n=1 Tax=Aquimarina algiphila TaxID=2047982 RepID=UPI00232DA76D|nr:hypothetical protein [Aquimarina algiphila]